MVYMYFSLGKIHVDSTELMLFGPAIFAAFMSETAYYFINKDFREFPFKHHPLTTVGRCYRGLCSLTKMINTRYWYRLVASKLAVSGRAKIRFVVLLTVASVLVCLQLVYPHFSSTALNKSHISTDEPLKTRYRNPYFESENGFQVIVQQNGRRPTLEGDVHTISDYTEKEYYLNAQYPEYTNQEQLDAGLDTKSTFKEFVSELLENVLSSDPNIEPINNAGHYNKSNVYGKTGSGKVPLLSGKLRENKGNEPIRSKEYLRSYMQLSEDEMAKLTASHKRIVELLPDKFPDEFEKNFKRRGILYAGGGKYNWLVLLSLVMLRNTGSRLPVEVFIPSNSEYSSELCKRVFPVFGAECLLMDKYADVQKFEFKGYQLKSMALLLTSFEEVLMLDSDNIPVKNPDLLFVNEPFKSKGMVVWPDFWRRSTSPLYYDIANITVNETHQVRFSYGDERDHPQPLNTHEDYEWKVSFHDLEGALPEASSETGQLMINKKTHAKAIFLSLYYNFFGPGYYYGLFSQGQAGEGDKETILAAAHKMGLPYYQVQEYIREFGDVNNGHVSDIHAMGQYDSILDYIQSQDPEKYKDDKTVYDRNGNNYLRHKYRESETMFLHCNQPKLYPWEVDGNGFRKIHDDNGNTRRLYSHYLRQELGFDAEAKIWESMQWLLCKHGDIMIEGLKDPELWCRKVTDQLQWLRAHPEDIEIKE